MYTSNYTILYDMYTISLFQTYQALSERLNVHLESQGRRIACGSLPLGPVATATPESNATEIQAEVAGSSATG